MRKEKVTPKGMPPLTNPMNSGMLEQEQKGVIAPNNEASRYCIPYSFLDVRKLRSLYTGEIGIDNAHYDAEMFNNDENFIFVQ